MRKSILTLLALVALAACNTVSGVARTSGTQVGHHRHRRGDAERDVISTSPCAAGRRAQKSIG